MKMPKEIHVNSKSNQSSQLYAHPNKPQ
uniref:Uncharacterized protein n=1 Tax=Rhizophora mucronata TaxID=61149 RepID=A0A2P2NBE4_RHIMU